MSNLTANQHHVWQYHLKAWANKKDQIWCLQKGKPEPFISHTRNVGSERFFYEFQELSEPDEQYLEYIINQSKDESLRKLNRGWVDCSQIGRVDEGLNRPRPIAIMREFDRNGSIAIPDFRCSKILIADELDEGHLLLIIVPVKAGIACTKTIEHRLAFILHRTVILLAKRLSSLIQQPFDLDLALIRKWEVRQHSSEREWRLEGSLYAQRHEYEIVMIDNRTDKPFITGDQPVINLLGLSDPEVELFYPLTPRRAMILSASRERYPSSQKDAGLIEVEGYNFQMYQKSDTQLYVSAYGTRR